MSDIPPPPPSPPLAAPPPAAPDPDIILPSTAKDPILILILAFFLGGIAYFVIGQWQKGIAAVAVWLCSFVFMFLTCGLGFFVYIPLIMVMVIDAYLQAQTLQQGHPIGQWTFFNSHL